MLIPLLLMTLGGCRSKDASSHQPSSKPYRIDPKKNTAAQPDAGTPQGSDSGTASSPKTKMNLGLPLAGTGVPLASKPPAEKLYTALDHCFQYRYRFELWQKGQNGESASCRRLKISLQPGKEAKYLPMPWLRDSYATPIQSALKLFTKQPHTIDISDAGAKPSASSLSDLVYGVAYADCGFDLYFNEISTAISPPLAGQASIRLYSGQNEGKACEPGERQSLTAPIKDMMLCARFGPHNAFKKETLESSAIKTGKDCRQFPDQDMYLKMIPD